MRLPPAEPPPIRLLYQVKGRAIEVEIQGTDAVYDVWYKDSLSDADWKPLLTAEAKDGKKATFVVIPSGGQRFYRATAARREPKTIFDAAGRVLEIQLNDANKTRFVFQYKSPQDKEISTIQIWKGQILDSSLNRLDPSEGLRAPGNAPYLNPYSNGANSVSGLTRSHLGDNPNGTFTYDMSLLAMLDFGGNSAKILQTYANNWQGPATRNNPQVQPRDSDFTPKGAILNDIRIEGFQGEWWTTWDWSAHGGPSSWIGIAALQNYDRNPNPVYLQFAKERAAFLMSMQDTDGGIRMGPKGQYSPTGDLSFYWNIKSTENNQSELYFFDMLYAVTKDIQYQRVADRIYEYLKKRMYDKNEHAFYRGEHIAGGVWVRDGHDLFATDTATWAPMDRMLEDPFFGATRADRLAEVEKMLDVAQQKTGVRNAEGKFIGVSFSISSANVRKGSQKGIVSIEWSSQYALRRLRIAEEWARLGDTGKAAKNLTEYRDLLATLGGFFKPAAGGGIAAPYAVWADGSAAVLIDTGHGWTTPRGAGSLAGNYFLFALWGFDPLLLGGHKA